MRRAWANVLPDAVELLFELQLCHSPTSEVFFIAETFQSAINLPYHLRLVQSQDFW